MKIGRFFEGFVIGGLIGAAAALLLAPDSGEEIRRKIQAGTEQIRDEVSQAAAQRRIELEQQLASLRAPRQPHPG